MAAHIATTWPPYPAFRQDGSILVIDNLPQFHPSGSIRITDETTFNQIVSDYADTNYLNGHLFGVSPATLMARYSGLAWTDNPSTSDYNNLVPIGRIFTTTAESLIYTGFGQADATKDGIQVASGGTFTDPNGTVFTEVSWCWDFELVLYTVLDSSTFTTEVVTWTGDGTSNRQITTTADLSTGISVVFIFPQTGAHDPVLATSAMVAAGKFATYASSPASTVGGVTALNATGFTVKDDAGTNAFVNTNTIKFTALVFHDTTGARLAVGSYAGSGVGQTINTGNIGPTMVWVAGRSGTMVYAETDHMPAGGSVAWSSVEAKSLTTGITAISPTGTFTVGTDNNVDNGSLTYYWVAMGIAAADTIRDNFNTYKVTGAGGVGATVSGLSFTPVFGFARPYVAGIPAAAWRSPWNAGTTSQATSAATALPSGGIESFGVGTMGIGATTAPNGTDVYGFAVKAGAGTSPQADTPTWIKETVVTNPDGTTSTIQTLVQSNTQPDDDYFLSPIATPTPSWWCNAALGYSVYQIDSPGTGWLACAGPTSDNGWYLSTEGFGAADIIVSGGTPADPRSWLKIATWATANTGMLGGSPGAACTTPGNAIVYPASGYTVGTDYPAIRVFNGRSDKELCKLPPTTANVIPKAVMSMLAANGTVYLTSWDSGTSSADWAGRVFQLDPETGVLTPLGLVFAAGEMPYALAWHMGRLWCGTNNGIGTVGKVYFFRPGIDTAWTQDYATSSSTAGGVDSMVSYKGKLYVGTDNAAASRGKVLVRDTAGAYTTSQTGAGGAAAVVNNGYLALTVFGSNLYASYWNNDTTAYSKIEKFDGSSWSNVYVGAALTLRPFIQLVVDDGELYAVGGGKLLAAALLVSANGTSWTDLTPELPETTKTLLPTFGVVVT